MLVLPTELTHRQAAACLQMLQQGLRSVDGSAVVADASALTVFDSSALAVLLACRRACEAQAKTFAGCKVCRCCTASTSCCPERETPPKCLRHLPPGGDTSGLAKPVPRYPWKGRARSRGV